MKLPLLDKEADVIFLGWLLMAGLLLFAGFLLYQYGMLEGLWQADKTRLSFVILALFLCATAYLGRCAWRLAKEYSSAAGNAGDTRSISAEHNHLLKVSATEALLSERLTERVHGPHQLGWFMADVLIRLGLVGTVIGFIFMLASVSDLNEQNTQVLKQLLTQMGGGMQVALYTTLTGLVCGLLLSMQCQWLDRAGDRLISRIIERSALAGSH